MHIIIYITMIRTEIGTYDESSLSQIEGKQPTTFVTSEGPPSHEYTSLSQMSNVDPQKWEHPMICVHISKGKKPAPHTLAVKPKIDRASPPHRDPFQSKVNRKASLFTVSTKSRIDVVCLIRRRVVWFEDN